MINYIPGLTFNEQLTIWLNSKNEEEYKLAKYIENGLIEIKNQIIEDYEKSI